MTENKIILVKGISGLLGVTIVKELKDGYNVIGLDPISKKEEQKI